MNGLSEVTSYIGRQDVDNLTAGVTQKLRYDVGSILTRFKISRAFGGAAVSYVRGSVRRYG